MNDSRQSLSHGYFTKEGLGELQLFCGVILYGFNYVAQRQGMLVGTTGPFTFTAITLSFAAVILCIFNNVLLSSIPHQEVSYNDMETSSLLTNNMKTNISQINWNSLILWGSLLGVTFFIYAVFQQIAMVTISAGMTGFIIGMFVVFVPIMEWILNCFDNRVTVYNWIASFISLTGLFLFSGCVQTDCFSTGTVPIGEYFALIGMIFCGGTIIICDIGCKLVDPLTLSQVNFIVSSILSIIFALIFEPDEWTLPFTALTKNYSMCIVVGFTQAFAQLCCGYGQRYINPTKASLILCLQAIVAAFLGYLFLSETLTYVELIGCVLMTMAAMLSAVGSRGYLGKLIGYNSTSSAGNSLSSLDGNMLSCGSRED